jgi:metallo-beta-lactamase class B
MCVLLNTLLINVIAIVRLTCTSQKQEALKSIVVYQSEDLVITQVSENAFIHTSFLQHMTLVMFRATDFS